MVSPLPQKANSVLISINPKAGRGSSDLRTGRLCDVLRQKGFVVEIHTDLDRVSERANLLFSQNLLRAVVGVGGDGTASELVNRTKPGVPITLLPAGTANLIAKNLKLPFNPDRAAKMIEFGATCSLDAGLADERLFLIVISAGIDADIVNRVHKTRMKRFQNGSKGGAHISYCSYIRPTLSAMFYYKFPDIHLESSSNPLHSSSSLSDRLAPSSLGENALESEDNERNLPDQVIANTTSLNSATNKIILDNVEDNNNSRDSKHSHPIFSQKPIALTGKWAFVFNLPQYGWGVPLVPPCRGNDSLLDYCVFQKGKFFRQLFNMIMAMGAGAHRFLPGTKIGQGSDFLLTSPEGCEIPYELDGDPGGILPVRVQIIPNRFTVLAPKKTIQKLECLKNKS